MNIEIAYNRCLEKEHERQFLYYVCIDKACNYNKRLLCRFCVDEHTEHRVTSLWKFLKEFKDLLKKYHQEEVQQNLQCRFYRAVFDILEETKKAKSIFGGKFETILIIMEGARKRLENQKLEEMSNILAVISHSDDMTKKIDFLMDCIDLAPKDDQSFTIKKLEINKINFGPEEAEEMQITYKNLLKNLLKDPNQRVDGLCAWFLETFESIYQQRQCQSIF